MAAEETPVWFDVDAEQLADLTRSLLAIDTSNPPGDTREIADLVESYLADALADRPDAEDGVSVERLAVDPAKPNVLATVPGERPETLLYLGHYDTVPYDETAWEHDPLGERVGDRIYGRGATDMKGSLAAMLATLAAAAAAETSPPVTLAFAFVSDEEVGGDAGLPAVLEREPTDDGAAAATVRGADACVIGEPTCVEGRHSVSVADRGSIWLTLEATGEAAHGSRPVAGTNAIDRLYGAIETVRERLGGRSLDVSERMAPIVEESVAFYAPSMGAETARALLTRPSINLGTIEGGEAINSVPRRARAELDIRVLADVDTGALLGELRGCVADCQGVTIADVDWSVGTAVPVDSAVAEATVGTAEAVLEDRVYRRSATGGGDAKRLRNRGIPAVEFALGTDTVHAVDEYTTVDALADTATVYARLPAAWAAEIDGRAHASGGS